MAARISKPPSGGFFLAATSLKNWGRSAHLLRQDEVTWAKNSPTDSPHDPGDAADLSTMGASCQWLNATRRRRRRECCAKLKTNQPPLFGEIENYTVSGGFLDHAVAPGSLGLIKGSVGALGETCN
jgi:hypothetical protein